VRPVEDSKIDFEKGVAVSGLCLKTIKNDINIMLISRIGINSGINIYIQCLPYVTQYRCSNERVIILSPV